jgi:serine/threonine-protein phosphatase 4 regulatory subunit 1
MSQASADCQFPAVALTLGGERWQELRSRYVQLATSAQSKVTRSLAASLHEMARILKPEDVGRDLVPFFKNCLESTEDVRERVFDHLDIFIEHSPLEVGWELCECLSRSWSAGTLGSWRIRERLASHLPALFKLFHSQPNSALIMEVVEEALKDPFAAVRDAATKGVS